MFQVTRKTDDRLNVEFSGKLETEEMKRLLDELMEKSEGVTHGTMLFRINEFDFPSLGAIGVELSRMPSMFKFIRRFDRVAVVVGKTWLRKASEIEGALIPGVEIKAFDLTQGSDAEAWLQTT
ncbi:STAS/SEC14 domain-containing protein [Marinimicrobium sp. ABcell2]|uniref:STAS/SEC14 domain-containing protein n=1 Tax=Marinimicrobium sp. ABcell2 TaxID=3069751 RepID=UPI0027AF2FD1|nr:STAS/SEC14 domain-containing protein [Marinimicrobium sp. ABcell2]MDQ2076778.1 STAS/SEC14 domain-containing protein [Marinimicrobium sp. ABcell2]